MLEVVDVANGDDAVHDEAINRKFLMFFVHLN
jgi:hypothetical protein